MAHGIPVAPNDSYKCYDGHSSPALWARCASTLAMPPSTCALPHDRGSDQAKAAIRGRQMVEARRDSAIGTCFVICAIEAAPRQSTYCRLLDRTLPKPRNTRRCELAERPWERKQWVVS
eukprot:6183933-Pleurochrysis_carterae.AAC.2